MICDPNRICRLLPLLTIRTPTHRAQGTHRTARRARDADRSTEIHDCLIEEVGLAGRGDLAGNSPKKTRGLLLGGKSKEAGEHAGGVSVENRCIATKGGGIG